MTLRGCCAARRKPISWSLPFPRNHRPIWRLRRNRAVACFTIAAWASASRRRSTAWVFSYHKGCCHHVGFRLGTYAVGRILPPLEGRWVGPPVPYDSRRADLSAKTRYLLPSNHRANNGVIQRVFCGELFALRFGLSDSGKRAATQPAPVPINKTESVASSIRPRGSFAGWRRYVSGTWLVPFGLACDESDNRSPGAPKVSTKRGFPPSPQGVSDPLTAAFSPWSKSTKVSAGHSACAVLRG